MIPTDLFVAANLLQDGALVVIPTETVYGLAANVFDQNAVRNIFALKKRPLHNPLIAHIGKRSQLDDLAESIPAKAQQLIDAFWPGPLTLVLPKKQHVPDLITAGHPTVAVRMPNHPKTLALLRMLPFPLAAPSANPFGCISPTSVAHVEGYFAEEKPFILDGGDCQKGIESTIVGFEGEDPVLYRHGAISIDSLQTVVGAITIKNEHQKIVAPGMMDKHYAPHTPTMVTNDVSSALLQHENKKIGLLTFLGPKIQNDSICHEILSESGNYEEAARQLYAAMHRLDQYQLDLIIAEKFPEQDLGLSINDRLRRAATT